MEEVVLLLLSLVPLPPPAHVDFQSFRQAEWVPAGDLHAEEWPTSDEMAAQQSPLPAARAEAWVWAEGFLKAGVSRVSVQAEAVRLASAPAGSPPSSLEPL